MTTMYQANEFTTTLPEGLKDKTVHIFSLTEDGPSPLAVIVTRERPQEGETLEAYVARQTQLLQKRLPLFRVLARRDATIDGQPAAQLDYAWQSATDGTMFHRQVMLFAPAAGVILIVTATAKTRLEPQWEAMFNEFVAGLRLRA
jgi:hypothetical protein